MGSEVVLRTNGLRREYAGRLVVEDFTCEVRAGEVVVLVGPNGCGKTTSVEMALGLRKSDGGRSEVLGMDPRRQRRQLARSVGVALQGAGMHPRVRVREQLAYVAALYRTGDAAVAVPRLLGLQDVLDRPYGALSGGQQRRVMVAAALTGMPRFSTLDEPTSGVDLESRLQLWSAVHTLVTERGAAMLVTTHDLLEAERHADRVVVMRPGRIVARGTPAELVARSGVGHVVTLRGEGAQPPAEHGVVLHASGSDTTVGFPDETAAQRWLESIPDLGEHPAVLRRGPTLEDAYLVLAHADHVAVSAPTGTQTGGQP